MKSLKETSVLIVDDYEINLQVLNLILARFGLTPDLAKNGREAIEKYQQSPYQIVFMDLMMPEIDGYKATKTIRSFEKKNNLKPSLIIAVSANYREQDDDKYRELGFNDVMDKPFVYNDLHAIISKYFTV